MKVLLIGLDGFDHALATRWMGEGKLPALAKIAGRGAFAPMASLLPPISPAVWTSILTGVNPARHGVFDFTVVEGRTIRLPGGFRRHAPNVFEMLSRAGRSVLSVGFPATAPLEAVRGAVLEGWDCPFSVRGRKAGCHPAGLHDRLVRMLGKDYLPFDVVDQMRMEGRESLRRAADRLERTPLDRAALVLALLRPDLVGDVDMLGVYFPEPDASGHQFWDLHDPRSPRNLSEKCSVARGGSRPAGKERGPHDDAGVVELHRGDVGCSDAASGDGSRPAAGGFLRQVPGRARGDADAGLGDPVERVYGAVDRAVGMIEDGFSPDAVVVVSDHGMGGNGASVLSLNRFLVEAGHLRLQPGAGALLERMSRLSAGAARAVPATVRQLAARRGLRHISGASITMMRLGGIDWEGTSAFSEDLAYAPSIWLRPDLPPGRERRDLARKIAEDLRLDPSLGGAVRRVVLREELYRGPYENRIPDIIVDLALDGDYGYCLVPGHFRVMKRTVEPLPRFYLTGEKGRTRHGGHRPGGVSIVAPPVSHGEPARAPGIHDVAPLLLGMHGLCIPGYFDSSPAFEAGEALDLGSLAAASSPEAPASLSSRVKARLKNLGYI
jgi:predicted AlkP superfamily phosphohydrolase/phosphomutase